MNMHKTQKFVAVFAIALMIASIFVIPVLAEKGSGSSGSDDNSGSSGSNSGSGSGSNSGSSGSNDNSGSSGSATENIPAPADAGIVEPSVANAVVPEAPASGGQNIVSTVAGLVSDVINSIIPAPVPTPLQSPSGQGYALGKLDMEMEPELLIVQLGEERVKPGEFELKNRVYEGTGLFPVKINDERLLATDIKVKTSLRIRGGVSELRGSIDLALVTGEGIAMQFEGTVTKEGPNTTANIDIAVTAATGRFLGLIAFEGSHIMKIEESGGLGSLAEIRIFDISGKDGVQSSVAQPSIQGLAVAEPSAPATGIIIDKTLSQGPGYPTGPLNMFVPATELLLDRAGQVKEQPGQLEIKGRLYEAAGEFPVIINGESLVANEIKVSINLKSKAGAAEQQGTIDVDVGDQLTGGHLTLEYKGSAILGDRQIVSGGNFKTIRTTGIFAGLVAEGTYSLVVDESGNIVVPKADITISTTSAV